MIEQIEEVKAVRIEKRKTGTATPVPVSEQAAKPERTSVPSRLRSTFLAFSDWCNRLDMDDRGFWI